MNHSLRFDIRILFTLLIALCFSIQAGELELTEKEQAWLDTHPKILFGGGIFTPIDGIGANGEVQGMARDYTDLIASKLGIEFEHSVGNWADIHKQAMKREIDGIRLLVPNKEREKYLNFTSSYAELSYGFVVRDDKKLMLTFSGLIGKKLAALKSSYDKNFIAEHFPDINLISVNSYEEGVSAVHDGEADAFIGALIPIEYVVYSKKISNLRISPLIQKLPSHELTIGIRKDWPELIPILNKAIASITPEDREQIVSRWNFNTQITEVDIEAPPSFLIVPGIAMFLLMVFLAYRMSRKRDISSKFGNIAFRYGLLGGLFLFITIISLQAWWVLEYNKQQILKSHQFNLESVLNTTHERLNIWIQKHEDYLEQFSNNSELVSITEQLLNVKATKNSLISSKELADTRDFFIRHEKSFGGEGFFIINPEYISIGSTRDTNLGTANLIAVHRKDLLDRVFKGETLFIPPIETDVPLGINNGVEAKATMFFATPIKNRDSKVIAVLTQRLDPLTDFSTILNFGRLGETGETYAFSKKGLLLSESRFNGQLREIGLIGTDKHSSLSIDIRDPGGDMLSGHDPKIVRNKQPLTEMAASAVLGESGINMSGYRDYRGANVCGVWLWDDKLDFALATEMETKEVLSQYYVVGMSIFGVLGVTIILSIGAILFTLFTGERVSRNLRDNNKELELEIRERENAEKQLKDRETLVSSIVDTVTDAIITIDKKGIIKTFNSGAENIFLYTSQEIIGKSINALMPSDIASVHDDYLNKYKKSEGSIVIGKNMQLMAKRKGGSFFPIELSVAEMKIGEEQVFTGVIRDITERKRANDELLNYQENLENLVEHRTSELYKANRKLQELDKLKNMFLVSMSHEIRTPMNAILGFSELLATTKLNDEQKEYLSRAQNATDSLLTLLGDIIDLERIEAGQLSIYTTPSNLKKVVLEVVDLLKFEAVKKGLLLEYDVDNNLPQHLMCDSKRIRQILINLVGNSIKFTRKGSIHIGLHVEYQDEKHCRLEFVVTDTGIGIEQEKQTQIFDIFTQVDDSMTREEGGIGLGLSISKNLVEAMGGKIEVESEYGHGTTFSFELLLDVADSTEDEKDLIQVDTIHFANFKILLVEDNKDNRDLASGLLNLMGINVDEAFNGEMALDMVRSNSYDLILMDIQMPVMDGLTATRLIRQDGYTEIPIIALSAHTMAEEQQRSIEAGMNEHINKPFKLHDLQAILLKYCPDKAIGQKPLSHDDWVDELPLVKGLEFNDELYSYWLSKEHYLVVQERFLRTIPVEASKINKFLDTDNIIGVQQQLHKFKGMVKLFGAKRLFKIIEKLETTLRDNEQINLADLRREFNDAVSELTTNN